MGFIAFFIVGVTLSGNDYYKKSNNPLNCITKMKAL